MEVIMTKYKTRDKVHPLPEVAIIVPESKVPDNFTPKPPMGTDDTQPGDTIVK
jgi:hypothetical protein